MPFVIYVNRRSANHALPPRPSIPLLSGYIVGAAAGLAGPRRAGRKNSLRGSGGRVPRATRQTRVRFVPDDVHVVVIIIIAFCIITIISAATSVIYSRSRACIMRRTAPGAYHDSPLFIHRYSAKTADDRNRRRAEAASFCGACMVTRSETAREVPAPRCPFDMSISTRIH